MRRFAVVLAGLGLVLLFMTGAAYLYFKGQIPPVQLETERFVLRADADVLWQPFQQELRAATTRFDRLLRPASDPPRLEVAIIDDPKQMNAVALYVAIRQSMGTPAEGLPLPYPTPRLVSMLLGEPQTEAGPAAGRRSLGHEAGHWLIRLHLLRQPEGPEHLQEREKAIPGWLREGIAGFCESTEARLGALLRMRTAIADSASADALDWRRFLVATPPAVQRLSWAHQDARMNGTQDALSELYYAQALLLVEYLEARHPRMVRKWIGRDPVAVTAESELLLQDQAAFHAWILTVPPLSL